MPSSLCIPSKAGQPIPQKSLMWTLKQVCWVNFLHISSIAFLVGHPFAKIHMKSMPFMFCYSHQGQILNVSGLDVGERNVTVHYVALPIIRERLS